MEHQSLYRKYRSQSFGDVMGQGHVTRTLQNALRTGRVAHAYLFCGPRGTGKTSTARLLAKALNCEKGPTPEPCNTCDLCMSITSGRSMDVVEVDAASETGIENVREVIINNARYAPAEGRYKVYIIDEVHDLSRAAFDGLLKTLEEPPPHVIFVLATTETHKVPATIISRCQRFEFRRGSLAEVQARVEYVASMEGISIEPGAATLIARAAQGGWRDALSLLEQVISYGSDTIAARDVGAVLGAIEDERLADLTRCLLQPDALAAIRILDEILAEGKDIRQFLHNFADYLRDCLLQAMGNGTDTTRPLIALDSRQGMLLLELTARAERELRWNTQHRLVIELMLLRMAAPDLAMAAETAVVAPAPRPATRPATQPAQKPVSPSAPSISPSPTPPLHPSGHSPGSTAPPDPFSQRSANPPGMPLFGSSGSGAPAAESPADEVPAAVLRPDAPPLTLPLVQQQWKALLNRVFTKSRRLNSVLKEGEVVSVEGSTLTLRFQKQYHYQAIEELSARRAIEGVAADHFGHPVRLVCVLAEQVPTAAAPAARDRRKISEPVTEVELAEIFPGWEIHEA